MPPYLICHNLLASVKNDGPIHQFLITKIKMLNEIAPENPCQGGALALSDWAGDVLHVDIVWLAVHLYRKIHSGVHTVPIALCPGRRFVTDGQPVVTRGRFLG